MALKNNISKGLKFLSGKPIIDFITGKAKSERDLLGQERLLGVQEDIQKRADQRALDLARSQGEQASKQYGKSMADFNIASSGSPESISKLQMLIRQQALPEQQRALEQGKIALQQQGVRGPEAALMLQRQQNRLQSDLANRAEQVALQQALSDRDVRQQFASQRAMQEAAQARADRTAQQEFARQRALASQEKSFAKGLKASNRPRFNEQKQARSIDSFVGLPGEQRTKLSEEQTGLGRIEQRSQSNQSNQSTTQPMSSFQKQMQQQLQQLQQLQKRGVRR